MRYITHSHCYKKSKYFYKSLKNVKISDGITKILSNSFYNCSSICNIILPSTLSSLGSSTFYNCSSLDNIIIPNNVNKIFANTFYNCSSLVSIELPSNLISSASYAFYNCSALINVYYNGTIETWCKIDFGFNDEYTTPMRYGRNFYIKGDNGEWEELTQISIPDSITSLGHYQFTGFKNITKIFIPDSLISIGTSAFEYCSKLENVYYGGTIESWCNITFRDRFSNPMCYGDAFFMLNDNNEWYEVTEIIIPESVTQIGKLQFYGFSNVTNISLPKNLKYCGLDSFGNMAGLINVYYNGSFENWFNISFENRLSNPMYFGDYFFVKNISDEWEEVTTIVIPETITSLGNYQLYGFGNVTDITFSSSIINIGNDVFGSWNNSSSLTNVYYKGSIESWCNLLFSTGESNPMFYADHFYMKNEEDNWYEVTEIVIPNTITKIGDYQFYGFENVTSIRIPNNITSIGGCAFSECTHLADVYYTGTEEEWNAITIGSSNDCLTSATIHYNYVPSTEEE